MFSGEIYGGVLAGTRGSDAEVRRLDGCNGEDLAAEIGQSLRHYVDQHGFPDAIVTYSSGAAIETMALAREHGAVIGDSFDLVAKDCEEIMAKTIPGLIIARENIPYAAAFLCDALIHAIENPGAEPMQGLDVPTALEVPALARSVP
jgi:DNA-binding LacI/PurR family transcriptional regulator